MKIFTEKKILRKIILILMIFAVFNAVLPSNVSCAADDPGGKLMKPIMDFLLALGDFIMDLMHNVIYGMNTALIRVDLNLGIWDFLGVAAAVIAVAVLVFGAGVALVTYGPYLLGALGKAVGLTVAVATEVPAAAVGAIVVASLTAGTAAGVFARSSWFSDEAVLPLYEITPEEIFTGQIEMLNPNFFSTEEYVAPDIAPSGEVESKDLYVYGQKTNGSTYNFNSYSGELANKVNEMLKKYGFDDIDVGDYANNASEEYTEIQTTEYNEQQYILKVKRGGIVDNSAYAPPNSQQGATSGGSYVKLTFTVFYKEVEQVEEVSDSEVEVEESAVPIASVLKTTVAKWYYNIRNVALVAMMVILIYIGIRMMLCGIASQKAKYKNMFLDWLVAICLMFVMHYIMVFAMNVSESIISVFSSMNNKEYIATIYDEDGKIKKELKRAATKGNVKYDETAIEKMYDGDVLTWDAQNIMGLVRITAAENNSGTYIYMGYVLSFLVLVWYTLFFLVTYIKRILYLAFFTIISPFVAMTYPIDKIHDGKAQAFDMWLKEYIINLLIPIIHTVLYTVLINSAFELASSNIIYTLVAIGFMLPAEKFIRKMFGFDKAQTPGFLGGAAGAAVALSAFNNILKPRKPLGGKDNNTITGGSEKGNNRLNKNTDIPISDSIFGDAKGSKDPAKANTGRGKLIRQMSDNGRARKNVKGWRRKFNNIKWKF